MHKVCPQGEWLLQAWPGPGRVDRQQRSCVVSDLSQRGNIRDAQDGIGRCLGVDHFRVGTQRSAHLFQVAGVHQADLDAEARQVQPKQLDRTGITYFAGDQVVSAAQEGEDQRGDRRHPAGESPRRLQRLPSAARRSSRARRVGLPQRV